MTHQFVLAQPHMLSRIVEIYNQNIASRLVTADLEEVTVAQRQAWFDFHNTNPSYPLWVVLDAQEQIMGWFSLSPFYGRMAYRATAEVSIYLDEQARGKGLGSQIIAFLKEQMPVLGLNTLLAFIFRKNVPSINAFLRHKFKIWGDLPNVANMETHLETLVIMGFQLSYKKAQVEDKFAPIPDYTDQAGATLLNKNQNQAQE
ncbi:GNAT family N-acetyltransferase [Psittacicella gerlachiana]|uniref:N-acetyltransferase domain-containing protein n=1 Tax=Psittacicella gerlachiana TaxID=2028574 RepID=A0A3A1Y869_9GAMM|nr:GNAT family N-acetyltransferase [Psittacicella gerlachiana]RIY33506.1 hypothetical protein CKF59_06325 [Psittacicella gerlachiana]